MPAIAPFTVTDGAATPVARTYNPAYPGEKPGDMEYRYDDTANPLLRRLMSLRFRVLSSFNKWKKKPEEVQYRTTHPIVRSVSGQDVIVGQLQATTTYQLDLDATEQERKNLRVEHSNTLGSPVLIAIVDKMEKPW